ncbi:hypothetical protein [Rhodococcus daqingensis]|uniref:Uncharacterized protein n=1 Tax=Rhodococcus daqingensis TaxID=2479363 RepID=A0ABW2RW01_9NOCA
MNRRLVASLMFIAAGLLAVPATAQAAPPTSENCVESGNGQACALGSVSTPAPIADECSDANENEDCASGGSSIVDLGALLKSFSGGIGFDSQVG